jgi:outer membrane protein W
MKKVRTFSLLAGSLVALAMISVKANAATAESEWGDMGYAHPAETQVEPIPMAMTDAPAPANHARVENDNDEIASTISSAELMESEPKAAAPLEEVEVKPAKKSKSITDISTVQNTYGVETEERQSISVYAAPFAGVTSMVGNDAADSSPQYTAGGTVGLLISNNMLVDASFTHAETAFSNPRTNSAQNVYYVPNANLMTMKQNSVSGGARFFILGRESRIRPFLGAGVSYTKGTLAYSGGYATAVANQSQFSKELDISEYQGFGELGAEVAITKNIAASVSFAMSGILSGSTSANDTVSANSYDPTRQDVANSVSRTASYCVAAGLGIYF